jgi:ribonucleotide reductase beta subunit family protein with ferritin-like domain/putative sterol carrier protein
MSVTTTTGEVSSGLHDVDYVDLYARWERGNWSAMDIDFAADRRDWHERLTADQRQAALWNYSLFLHGEDAVADALGPYIDAAPLPEHKYFLATQQADEARHAVFFKRFIEEVVYDGTGSVDAVLDRTRPHLNWGYKKIFGRLEKMSEDLRRTPTKPMLAAGIALYHIVIEASLAQSAQHRIEEYLEAQDFLPGFREGMRQVALDEQRHIAFGVKLLAELVADDPACRESVTDLIREIVPYAMSIAIPPEFDSATYMESLGFTLEELYVSGQGSFFQKLRLIGMPYESLNGAVPFPPGAVPEETASRSLRLVKGSLVGEKRGPVARDPASVELLFDTIRFAVDHRHAPRGQTTIQFDFEDLEPWYLVIDNGASRAERGRAQEASLRLGCRYEDWVDVVAGRQDARIAMLKRRIRPRGSLRALMRMQRMFGA